jgi:hypothetical protein
MTAGNWATLVVAIASLIVALAALPAWTNRKVLTRASIVLITIALGIGTLDWTLSPDPDRTTPPAKFEILTPQKDQRISMAGGTVVSGTTGDIGSDTIWVFDEDRAANGTIVYFFGGQASIDGDKWRFEDKPIGDEVGQTATITVVRANSDCDRLPRAVKHNADGDFTVDDPIFPSCTVLGRIHVFIATG